MLCGGALAHSHMHARGERPGRRGATYAAPRPCNPRWTPLQRTLDGLRPPCR